MGNSCVLEAVFGVLVPLTGGEHCAKSKDSECFLLDSFSVLFMQLVLT